MTGMQRIGRGLSITVLLVIKLFIDCIQYIMKKVYGKPIPPG